LLEVRNLSVDFATRDGPVPAVRDVSLSLPRDSIVALVGESGAGKTTLGLAILNLLPGNAQITGEVLLDGRNVLTMSGSELRSIRGREISIVFQDPASGLNPVLTIGDQVSEILCNHLGMSRKEARRDSIDVLRRMGIRDPEKIIDQYPFHLSGGMAQRVMIGIAMALEPRLLIADEPTSSLDVTVQAQILAELRQLKESSQTSILLITHDLGVVAQMAEEVAIMYAGQIVEQGTTMQIFKDPAHPYTEGLLATRPRLDAEPVHPLRSIRGPTTDMESEAELCPFLPRCHKALSRCRMEVAPELRELEGRHAAACYNPIVLN
jgi:oligopeptide/dipeptide ABC transporter ATP-binding protein